MKETGCTFDEARLELVMEQIRLAGIEAEAELDSIATTAAPLPDSSAAHGAHLHTFNHHHPATAATAALRSPSTVSRQFNVFFTVEGVDLEGYTTTSTKARPVTTLHPLLPRCQLDVLNARGAIRHPDCYWVGGTPSHTRHHTTSQLSSQLSSIACQLSGRHPPRGVLTCAREWLGSSGKCSKNRKGSCLSSKRK